MYFKQREREAPGCRVDDRVLFIDEVEYETAATVDNVPCLLFRFQVQHVSAFYNAEGDCVAGHPDEVRRFRLKIRRIVTNCREFRPILGNFD